MDCNINYLNFRSSTELSEKELVAEMVELYALCKAIPSTPRDQHGKITILLKAAEKLENSSPALKKIAAKLTKMVADLPESPLPLLIPNYGNLPLVENTFGSIPLSYELNDVLENKPMPIFPSGKQRSKLMENYYKSERDSFEKKVKELQESSPEKLEHLRLYARLKTEEKNKKTVLYEFNKLYTISSDRYLIGMDRGELEAIHEKRLQLLADERLSQPKNDKKIVIIGGGPAGLIRALYSIQLGYSVTILEKRDGHYSRDAGSRPNILHLGHDGIADLNELIDLGVFDRLILSGAVSKSLYGGFQVAICDLEREIAALVKEWQPGALIPSVKEIDVIASESEKAVVSFNGISLPCDLLILADGARSSIARKLGVSYNNLSTTVHAPIGFFEADEGAHFKALHVAQSIFTTLLSAPSLIATLSLEEMKKKLATKGILFRKGNEDYVGISLSEEEEKELAKLPDLEKKKLLRKKLEIGQREIDLVLSAFAPNHTMRAGHLVDAKIIPIQIKKAESPIFSVGKTLVLIRGDAHGTTHPASGYGAKTALASLSAEKELLPYFEEVGVHPLFIELFRREAEKKLSVSQGQGFKVLRLYRQNYEKRDLFFTYAKEPGSYFSDLDLSPINRLYTVQKWRALTNEEIQSLQSLKRAIVQNYLVHTEGLIVPIAQEKYKKIFEEKTFPLSIMKEKFSHLLDIKEEALASLNPFQKALPGSAKLLRATAMKCIADPDKSALFGLVSIIEEILGKN